jgi:hypothetical protein
MKEGDFFYCKKDFTSFKTNSSLNANVPLIKADFVEGNFYECTGAVMSVSDSTYKTVWLISDDVGDSPVPYLQFEKHFCTEKELLNKKLKKVRKSR